MSVLPDIDLADAANVLRAAGVRRAGFFGSRVRGVHAADSDLDVVIEPPDRFSLFDLIALQQSLTKAVGLEAHVTTYGSLHPRMRDEILSEEVRFLDEAA